MANNLAVPDQSLLMLHSIFPRGLVVAALDLIDRENGGTPYAQHHYEVLGSTATYQVFLNLPGSISVYCTCPAFTYLVLASESHLMCKHVLAAHLAEQMSLCIDRPIDGEEPASL
ncbi:hypothetical protein B0H10DRAFT_1812747 [Mycena sp. CBHHK59/15]|nr:hypothetical protein B0H10DRAFT_1812747 [Mycena sp. CBHHK59/15]